MHPWTSLFPDDLMTHPGFALLDSGTFLHHWDHRDSEYSQTHLKWHPENINKTHSHQVRRTVSRKYGEMWRETQERRLKINCTHRAVGRTLLTGNGRLISEDSLVASFANAAQSCKGKRIHSILFALSTFRTNSFTDGVFLWRTKMQFLTQCLYWKSPCVLETNHD